MTSHFKLVCECAAGEGVEGSGDKLGAKPLCTESSGSLQTNNLKTIKS